MADSCACPRPSPNKKQIPMAPKYKLTYFAAQGISETIRFLLAYMEADWEDERVPIDQWPVYKPKFPWGTLPIMTVDGKVMTQSIAIMRYLGDKVGLAGDNAWERTQIDMIADIINVDLRVPATAFMWEPNETEKKVKKEKWQKETLPTYMKKLDSVVKENKGYLANSKLSWADFLFVGLCDYLSYNAEVDDMTADYVNLHALRDRILSLPAVAKYIATRPETPF